MTDVLFLFSFWFEHFGVGTVKWHFRPHSYFHSKDIRHFPIYSPEQFFVFVAAVKLARMCKDTLSLAVFELMILRTLNTYLGSDADPLPRIFKSLDEVAVKDSICDFYYLLSHDTAVNTQTCNESLNNATKSRTNPSEMQQVEASDAVAPTVTTSRVSSPPIIVTDTTANVLNSENIKQWDAEVIEASKPSADRQCFTSHSSSTAAVYNDQAIAAAAKADRLHLPPSHLPFTGLPNIDQTCWMNAALQCLLHTPELSLLFLESSFDGSSLHPSNVDLLDEHKNISILFKKFVNYSAAEDGDCSLLTGLLHQLHAVLTALLLRRDPTEGLVKLKDSFEALLCLVEVICPSMFNLVIESHVDCLSCGLKLINVEPNFLIIPFVRSTVRNVCATLTDCLNAYFAAEYLDGSCQCESNSVRSKQLFLQPDLPNLFVLVLKRWEKTATGQICKIDRKLEFTPEYDFGTHLVPNKKKSDIFRLYAVICHHPNPKHFTAYLQPKPEVSWIHFDDQTVTECTEADALLNIKRRGYVFFFRRQTSPTSTAVKSDVVINISDELVPSEKIVDNETATLSHHNSLPPCIAHPDEFLHDLAVLRPAAASPQRFASAARIAHAFPYKFSLFKFDLSASPNVDVQTASSLFEEFTRLKVKFSYLQYADDYYDSNKPLNCLERRFAPTITHKVFIGVDTIDWFFQAIATLFPNVMILSPFLLNMRGFSIDQDKFDIFLQNVRDRRPTFVLHPVSVPKDPSKIIDENWNPCTHWVLGYIVFNWSKSPVSCKISVLDPFSDKFYIDPVVQWYARGKYFQSFNPKFLEASVRPIQAGKDNIHCGVYVMVLALNAVLGTLSRTPELFGTSDTKDVGLEFRKCVAWDCTQFPLLLDTCLLMSPCFSPILQRSGVAMSLQASKWWVITPYHNIADSLSIKFRSVFTPVSITRSVHNEQEQTSSFNIKRGKIDSDGPWFFENEKYFVKVHCIGLIGHSLSKDLTLDHAAIKRAAIAFHEACATQFVCQMEGWYCDSFGLICVGLVCPCAFVCIVRELGTAVNDINDVEVGKLFHSLCSPSIKQKKRVLHGDAYRKNLVVVGSKYQLVDCERTSLTSGETPPLALHTWYAASISEMKRNDYHIRALMLIIRRSGLDETRKFFSEIYKQGKFLQMSFDADLFEQSPVTPWKYDAFLHLFQLLLDAELKPKLIDDNTIECILGNNIVIQKNSDYSIEVSCADGSLKNVVLATETDTSSFFQKFSIPQRDVNEFRGEDSVHDFSGEDSVHEISGEDSFNEDAETIVSASKSRPMPKRQASIPSNLPAFSWMTKHIVTKDLLDNVITSMLQRYNKVPRQISALPLNENKVVIPENILRPQHFGCHTVIVQNAQTQQECIQFLQLGGTHFSFDTESPCPKHKDEGISLIQIGTTLKVFLIHLSKKSCNDDAFLLQFRQSLKGKTLIHFGGSDPQELSTVIGHCDCDFFDLQQKYFKNGSNVIGLSECVYKHLVATCYHLSKVWTHSGWDVFPLHHHQVDYATLDVICAHALYLSCLEPPIHVFKKFQNGHSFMHPSMVNTRHGFCDVPEYVGHFEDGNAIRGFCIQPKLVAHGFKAASEDFRATSDPALAFSKLLSEKRFCCSMCSFSLAQRLPFLRFIPSNHVQRHGQWFRTFGRLSQTKKVSSVEVVYDSRNSDPVNDAIFCLSMLGNFFQFSFNKDDANLVSSVHQDVRDGYISKSFAHLVTQ